MWKRARCRTERTRLLQFRLLAARSESQNSRLARETSEDLDCLDSGCDCAALQVATEPTRQDSGLAVNQCENYERCNALTENRLVVYGCM